MDQQPDAVLIDLPVSVRGFSFEDADGNHVVVVNSRLSRSANEKTYRRELKHCAYDFSGDSFDVQKIEHDAHQQP